MAARLAGYDFQTKMRINMLVIESVAKGAGISENDAAAAIAESPVHGKVQELADAIQAEAERLKAA